MDRINGLYTILVGGLRQWQNKNVATGVSGTQFDQVFQNDLQEELCQGIIAFAGGVPTAGVQNQLRTYLAAMLAPGPIFITASQNVTVPPWATRCRYLLLGGGASGNGTTTASQRGGGGGGGGRARGIATGLTPGAVIPVTIGGGGLPISGSAGSGGGTTSFGSYASATGGGILSVVTSGGVSGVGVGGSANDGLGDGTDGNLTAVAPGGDGGGPGGRGANGNGHNGVGYGGGGGGCTSGYIAGIGAGGYAELEWLP